MRLKSAAAGTYLRYGIDLEHGTALASGQRRALAAVPVGRAPGTHHLRGYDHACANHLPSEHLYPAASRPPFAAARSCPSATPADPASPPLSGPTRPVVQSSLIATMP
jgi:hypothetical protein